MNKGNLLIITSVLITLVLWYVGISDTQITLKLISRATAIIGVILLSWNYILATGLYFFESIFGGLENLYSVHHWIGKWGFLFILFHPLILVLNALDKSLQYSQYIFPSPIASYSLGVFALYLFIILLIVTIFLKLPYHLWKITHDLMGVPLFFLILHVYLISSDVSKNLVLRYWVLGFLIIAFVSLYKRFFYEKFNGKKYFVDTLSEVSKGIWKIGLKGEHNHVDVRSGQFVFLKRSNGEGNDELHPFSIISSNDNGEISLGVKKLGDYTKKINRWEIGEEVLVYGPHGRFGEYFNSEKREVWIAGGVGITPFLSILDGYMKKDQTINATLIYVVSGEELSVPFIQTLEIYQNRVKGFALIVWNTKMKGRIKVEDVIQSETDRYLICASASLTQTIVTGLKNSGVKSSKIKKELFTLY